MRHLPIVLFEAEIKYKMSVSNLHTFNIYTSEASI